MDLLKTGTVILIFLIPLVSNLVILPVLAAVAPKIGLMDCPGRRKVHCRPKARVGGLGMALSLFAILLFIPSSNRWGLYTGCMLAAFIGMLDDIININYRWKLLGQMAAAALVVLGSHTLLSTFGNLLSFGPIDLGLLSVPLTIFCTVGLMNAINMMDGLDGLASGVTLVAVSSFAVLSYLNGQQGLFLLCIALMGALCGFLKYNVHPSKVFMGDAGSLNLGLILAFLSIAVTQKPQGHVPPVASLIILAIPILDTVTVMIMRVIRGRSPFKADKTHLHHVLLKLGFNQRTTAKIIILVSAFLSAIAVAGTIYGAPEYYLFGLFAGFTAMYVVASICIKEILKAMLHLRKNSGFEKIDSLRAQIAIMLTNATKVSRKGERINLKSPGVCIGHEGRGFSGTITELGHRGFSANIRDTLLVEDKLPIEISLNGGDKYVEISGTVEIQWSQKLDNGDGYRYGFKFIYMDRGQREVLWDYLDSIRGDDQRLCRIPVKKLPEAGLQTALVNDGGYIDIKGAKNKAHRA